MIELLVNAGARIAEPGEFTLRAYLNGKMDLSQAEAVADLIASNSAASHRVARNQMRGGFSAELAKLREQLLNFISLIELELDFSEEDVEFADRQELTELVDRISRMIRKMKLNDMNRDPLHSHGSIIFTFIFPDNDVISLQ